jgi:NADH dehydrogenase
MAEQRTKVLIVGGGFAGIKTALEIASDSRFEITLMSTQDSFRYYPTLYHTATGGRLSASRIPLTEIFKGKQNVRIINDTAVAFDQKSKTVTASSKKSYNYDILVLALGVVTNYFGIKGLQEYSYGIKSVEDASELREHIHKLLSDERKPDLNYVVIGGGPTGVELAGALPGYIKHVMKMHKINEEKNLNIDLVEAAPILMSRMPKPYSLAIQKRLQKLGVKLLLNEKVEAETADALMVSGQPIQSHTVVWTAGVTNHPFFTANKFELTDHGKVKVNEFLQAAPDVYVIGDNADTQYAGMAQTALYDGKFLAENLKKQASSQAMKAYKPKRPVYVTPVGPSWAAVQWGGLHLYGWVGWVLRSAADFIGFHDYEPWWIASKHWMAEYESEDTCAVCSGRQPA